LALTTQAISQLVQGELIGPADIEIASMADLQYAGPGQLSIIGSERYVRGWADSKASAALVNKSIGVQPGDGRALIRVEDADLAMAQVLEAYAPKTPLPPEGTHPSAIVDPTVTIGAGARIGPNCVIKSGATIGQGTTLHAGVTIMDNAVVGESCELWPGVVIRDRCVLGDRCIIHSNSVIGADGFGYRPDLTGPQPRLVKIPHIGIVRIGNDVEIGASTTIDRAKFDATIVGDGSKIDNQVQIGHNCRLGRMVVIAGCCAMGGSVTVHDGVQIGGGVSLADHLTIGAGARLAGGTSLMNDVPPGETWGGVPGKLFKSVMREEIAIRQLPGLLRELKKEKRNRPS